MPPGRAPSGSPGVPQLVEDLDTQIDAMIEDGTYVRLYRKHFHDPIAADLLTVRRKPASQIASTDLEPTKI